MKVVVTGGSGFIGSNLVSFLSSCGYDVVVYDNLSTGYIQNIESLTNVSFINGDIRDFDLLNNACKDASVIFHLAASVGNKLSIDNPIYDSEVNVLGSLNVLNSAKLNNIDKVVLSSSAGIYGELKTLPIDESHIIDPDTPYGVSKLCMEKHSIAYSKLYGIETINLRYFNVYGKNQRFDKYGNVIPIFMNNILNNIPITVYGDGEQTRDFINVNDVVQANFNASQANGVIGSFNIGSSTRISINDLLIHLRDITNRDFEVIYTPKRPGDVLHSLADISRAQNLLSFKPDVDFFSGLSEYVDWITEEFNKGVKV